MGSHPLNLAVRFVLELGALASLAVFGWVRFDGGLRWVASVGLPLGFMLLWGVFAVPEDPSRGGTPVVVVPGAVRLVLELALFAAAIWALRASGHGRLALLYGITLVLHYAASWDRIGWLLQR